MSCYAVYIISECIKKCVGLMVLKFFKYIDYHFSLNSVLLVIPKRQNQIWFPRKWLEWFLIEFLSKTFLTFSTTPPFFIQNWWYILHGNVGRICLFILDQADPSPGSIFIETNKAKCSKLVMKWSIFTDISWTLGRFWCLKLFYIIISHL